MPSTHGPLVSIVTPVYNGEKYLRECIQSVLGQTYKHWDYTIVNNCSTDRTLEIAQEYAAKESRIRIHSNETFVRVIPNHNIAFRQVSPYSKYCKPVAADDMLLPECLERMVGLAESYPNVAIVGAYGLYSNPEMGVYGRGVPYSSSVLSGRSLCRSWLLGKGPSVWGAPTFTLFRSDIVRSRQAFYNEANIHADSEICLEFLEDHDFGFVQQILTFMRVQTDSLTSVSDRLNTHLPYVLYALKKYGPKYLSEEELKLRIRKCLREYYSFLGWQLLKRQGKDFWKYHRERLAVLGYHLSRARLAASTASYLFDLAFNPKRTVERVTRTLHESLSRS